jgi:hypothetical protein
MYVGLETLIEPGYFTTVLHLYNMLQQLRVLCPELAILENLSNVLGPAVFQGSGHRPTKDFVKMLRIFMGEYFLRDWEDRKLFRAKTAHKRTVPFEDHTRINAKSLPRFVLESLNKHYYLSDKFLADITDKRFDARKHNVKSTVMSFYTPSDLVLRAKE